MAISDTRFTIDRIRERLLADGVVTECTHGTSLSDPCADCDIVIDAVLRAAGPVDRSARTIDCKFCLGVTDHVPACPTWDMSEA